MLLAVPVEGLEPQTDNPLGPSPHLGRGDEPRQFRFGVERYRLGPGVDLQSRPPPLVDEEQEGAVVGDRCHIEAGSTIRPLIKLWPDKIIEAGSVVTMSLIWGSKWQGALFRNLGVSGIANVEMTPDFACKLGASYGAFLKKGATVITSRDSTLVCRMLSAA